MARISVLLEVDEDEAGGAHVVALGVTSVPASVVLADVDGTVGINALDVHDMTVETGIANGDVARLWIAVDRNACVTGVIVPLVGVAVTTPVRHVAARGSNFPGCVAYAFAVIHTPTVDDSVHRNVAPFTRVSAAASRASAGRAAREAGVGSDLLATQL